MTWKLFLYLLILMVRHQQAVEQIVEMAIIQIIFTCYKEVNS